MANEHSLLDAIKAIGHDLKESGVEAVADAVADIRHKVVEEGWLGRQITPDRQAQAHSPEPAEDSAATVAVSEPTPADSDYDKWLTERYGAEPQPQEQAQDREKDREVEP